MFTNFEKILEAAKASEKKRVMAVAAAEDEPVIQAALQAKADGLVDVIFVGNAEKIKEIIKVQHVSLETCQVVAASPEEAGQRAVDLIREGSADFLMKGLMDTKALLGPVVKKENGLRTGRVMSHFALNELPGYHKLIVNTDGGMLLYPTLEEKVSIIENAVITLRTMGYEQPKVAVLAGVEKPNPKMIETMEAAELMKMNQEGKITGCVVEGPVSYDVALSAEIARHKGAPYAHCGDYDVLVAPNLAAGNILGKTWSVTAKAKMAGIIVGAKVPIVLTSRGATAEEKYLSIALAAVASGGGDL